MGLLFVLLQRLHQAAIGARRQAHTARYLGWATLSGLSMGLALGCLLLAATSLWVAGLWMVAVILLAVCLVPTTAPWLVRHVLVPGGMVRAAHVAGRASMVAGADPAAYALVVSAWAVAGARRAPKGAAVAWVQAQREQRGALGDAEVVATAFLLARQDAPTARQLLRSVPELAEVHPAVRELAGEWLAVDAAERGAWHELLPSAAGAAATTPSWPATPLRFFLEGVAARMLGDDRAPSSAGLAARWLLAPYRRQTYALLRAAGQPPQVAADQADKPPSAHAAPATVSTPGADLQPSPVSELWTEAVRRHLQVLLAVRAAGGAAEVGVGSDGGRGAGPGAGADDDDTSDATRGDAAADGALAELVEAWDSALASAAVKDWLDRRAQALAAPGGAASHALAELQDVVVAELRDHVDRHRLAVPRLPSSRFGQALAARLRHGRLDALELAFTRWSDRVAHGAKLSAIDEWREFLAVRKAYRDLVRSGGQDLRRLAFPRAFDAANQAAVALWNQRSEHVLAHAILSWQLEEARAVGDVAAIELGAKNCALKVQTRTGVVAR